MNIKDVDNLLIFNKDYSPSETEKEQLSSGNLYDPTFARLTSKKFRKTSLGDTGKEMIERLLHQFIENKEPIKLMPLFGGYKQVRNSSFPGVNWAEVFAIAHALEFASFVETIYPYGVEVIFRSDEVVVPYLTNIKKEDVQVYTDQFRKLIELFSEKIKSKNIRLQFILDRDSYPEEKLIAEMDNLYKKYEQKFDEFEQEKKENVINKSIRNILWGNGFEDLSNLNDEQKNQEAKKRFIMHEAFIEADDILAEEILKSGIWVGYRKARIWIHIGTCASSIVQFWASGEGILKKKLDPTGDEKFVPYILSHNQFQDLEFDEYEIDNPQLSVISDVFDKVLVQKD